MMLEPEISWQDPKTLILKITLAEPRHPAIHPGAMAGLILQIMEKALPKMIQDLLMESGYEINKADIEELERIPDKSNAH